MTKRKNKIDIIIDYIKERHPDITIIKDAIGLIDKDQWILLAEHLDVKDRLLVVADMNAPKKIIILPINDTIAYWSARYILSMHPAARRHASECEKEFEQQNS